MDGQYDQLCAAGRYDRRDGHLRRSGNLYTVGEYGDFILRFEFRFLTEGVNNGIGIRTPMASMPRSTGWRYRFSTRCADLQGISDYQQHGSVYGVIPAERVKFRRAG